MSYNPLLHMNKLNKFKPAALVWYALFSEKILFESRHYENTPIQIY